MSKPKVYVPCETHIHGPNEAVVTADLGPSWKGMIIHTKPDSVFWNPTDIQPEGVKLSGWVEATIYSRGEDGLLVLLINRAFKPNPYLFNKVPMENTVEVLPPDTVSLGI